MTMRIRTNFWIEDADGKVLYGLGRHRILQAIREFGSIKAASEQLGISYRGLWGRLRLSEKRLGFPLVESKAGRGPSAGSRLTARGLALIDRYEEAAREIYSASDRTFDEHLKSLLADHDSD
jgi:molybdate transport system regulatory protein